MLEVLDDGKICLPVRSSVTGEVIEHTIDVLRLRFMCEECEAKHQLQTNEAGEYIATSAFLDDLASRLESRGITGCDMSLALQFWRIGEPALRDLQKKTNETPSSPSGSPSIQAD